MPCCLGNKARLVANLAFSRLFQPRYHPTMRKSTLGHGLSSWARSRLAGASRHKYLPFSHIALSLFLIQIPSASSSKPATATRTTAIPSTTATTATMATGQIRSNFRHALKSFRKARARLSAGQYGGSLRCILKAILQAVDGAILSLIYACAVACDIVARAAASS
ncbi:hypothetical protein EJ03DRAFT_217386 [Teratosphaeria nubilosa]|uniref:Uncharacterized protein n=1 Tax=Teratosphaeria nubilosa TaxID=161662 RepID=A0A6G1KYW8_9PEZI|nr:hypothetical protein EJ03DRAFT_217386 [Teratosphaeria nubilosa]